MNNLSFSSSNAVSGKFILSRFLGTALIAPIVLVVCFAIWLAVASVMENIEFGQSVDQIIDLVSNARLAAKQNKVFATQPNEDIIGDLVRAGLMSADSKDAPLSVMNPWNHPLTVQSTEASIMRIETVVPDRDCRRLAMFFSKDVKSVGVQLMEARSINQGIWRRFYDRRSAVIPREEDVEAACDLGGVMTLALVFVVR